MRTMKRASGAAAVALLALGLGACSEAKDAADKAADDAKDKASEAGSSLAADASDKAESALADATGGTDGASATSGSGGSGASGDSGTDGSGTDGAAGGAEGSDEDSDGAGSGEVGGVSRDLGAFAKNPAAKATGEFYSAREEVRGGGDSAALEAVTGADHFQDVLAWAEGHPSTGSFTVVVTAVDGSSVSACVGEDGEGPRVLTVEDGKVTGNARGDFAC